MRLTVYLFNRLIDSNLTVNNSTFQRFNKKMPQPIIKIENLSKMYRLGVVGTGTLSHDLKRWYYKMRGREDPYLKIGEANVRNTKSESDYVWALKDINLEVMPGEVLGIIGKNGAGKSTLLKILSKVTGPTTGDIHYNGRIGALLEVGTGFHPELTGRENIFLNGAILGMTKAEIKKKLDEIIDFSGVERYIDTPVKRYSSGMMVRLGFAVAAHLEPEILIVDEVLAVGDAEFQKKAIGKMQDVSKNEGRTVLFVSHNMKAVKNLCEKGALLKDGQLFFQGKIEDTIDKYHIGENYNHLTSIETLKDRSGTGTVIFTDFYLENHKGVKVKSLNTGDEITLVFVVKVNEPDCKNIDIGFSFHDSLNDTLSILYSGYQNCTFNNLPIGYTIIKCTLKNFCLSPGLLPVYGRILENGIEADWLKKPLGVLDVEMGDFYKTGNIGNVNNVKCLITGKWKISKQ